MYINAHTKGKDAQRTGALEGSGSVFSDVVGKVMI